MKVSIRYTVPVYVVVDTKTGAVDRVDVACEAVERDVTDLPLEEAGGVPSPSKITKAIVIAESATWPRWELS